MTIDAARLKGITFELPKSMGQQTIYINRDGGSPLDLADLTITSLMRLVDVVQSP